MKIYCNSVEDGADNFTITGGHSTRVSRQKGPICHALAWRVGPFWEDTIEQWKGQNLPRQPMMINIVNLMHYGLVAHKMNPNIPSFIQEMHLKILYAKWWLFWSCLNVLTTPMMTCIFRCHVASQSMRGFPASIATLAQRWPNVNPYVGPTLAHQRWANVDLSIGPTLAQRLHANVVPTSAQRWHTNVGPTLAQRYANGCMPTLYQHWPNGGCVTGFLWGEPIGHRSVTGWTNSRVE